MEKGYFFQKGKKICQAILANNWENHKNAEFFKEKKIMMSHYFFSSQLGSKILLPLYIYHHPSAQSSKN